MIEDPTISEMERFGDIGALKKPLEQPVQTTGNVSNSAIAVFAKTPNGVPNGGPNGVQSGVLKSKTYGVCTPRSRFAR